MRIIRGLPSMRRFDIAKEIGAAIRLGHTRRGFRVVEFSIQSNHLHFLVEGAGRMTLANGLRGSRSGSRVPSTGRSTDGAR